MTILQGTMQDGTVIPVQVDSQGRLVAEGLQGKQGIQGVPGPPGGSFALPAGPRDGQHLGWVNGALAWVGGDPYHPLGLAAGTGYIPAGDYGTPYFIDITPQGADVCFNSYPENGTAQLRAITDGSTTSGVYWTASDYLANGDVKSLLFDLRDFLNPHPGGTLDLYAAGLQGYGTYSAQMLTSAKTTIAGTDTVIAAGLNWKSVPFPTTARFLRVYTTVVSARLYWHAIRVGGVVVNSSKYATAAKGAIAV